MSRIAAPSTRARTSSDAGGAFLGLRALDEDRATIPRVTPPVAIVKGMTSEVMADRAIVTKIDTV